MPRLLYLMHVDWRWIKQRPHFIAEEIAKGDVAVRVLDRRIWRTDVLTVNETPLQVQPLRAAPGRLRVFKSVDDAILRSQARWYTRGWQPDAVWLTHPDLYDYVPSSFRTLPLIYDAMDDHSALASTGDTDRMQRVEGEVAARADLVLASSDSIRNRLLLQSSTKPVLVRNATPVGLAGALPPPENSSTVMRIGYVGTISRWFDFDSILALLDRRGYVEVHLFGPSDVEIPVHPRLVSHGPVGRDRLAERVSSCHAFVMPFLDGPIVRAVDPVKVYEYLSWRRPAIVCGWAETDHFGSLIHRFRTAEELDTIVNSLHGHERQSLPDREAVADFLGKNTWVDRGEVVRSALAHLLQPTHGR